jgi:hypothetical protein
LASEHLEGEVEKKEHVKDKEKRIGKRRNYIMLNTN